MSTIQTQWIKQDIAYSLFVNNQQTNIYFFPPSYEHFNFQRDGKKAIRKAIALRKMIQQGKIKPEDDNWNMFDQCHSEKYLIKEIAFFDKTPKHVDYMNKISSCCMYRRPTEQEVRERYINKTEWTQLIKRMIGGQLSDNVGCYIDAQGYSLFFY